MVPGTVGGGLPSEVARRGPDGQTAGRKAVVDVNAKGEGVPILGMEDEGHHHPVLGMFDGRPVHPAGKAVQGVVPRRLADRRLVHAAGKFVLAILDPVGPGQQQLAAPDAAHFVFRKTVDDVAVADRVGAKAGSHFGDDRALIAGGQDVLLPRGWNGGHCHRIIGWWRA